MRFRRSLALLLVLALPGAVSAAGHETPALFGTHETFSPDSAAFVKWHGLLKRFAAERRQAAAACASRAVERCEPAEWGALVAALKGLDLRAKLDRVNAAINRHPYVPSSVNWHESNRWETPFEFLVKGGQCQDYAIAKYLLLRAAGVPASSLRVVVLRDTRLGLDHAVTVAYVEGEALVLDNQRRDVVPASSLDFYRPYYSINEQGWWLHRATDARYAAAD
ncbi:MAG TPA: transglutaminase-like cysteine peptidase [Stellaceae bacterium]|nr:transglutaminase-like cysteine peptidase [Stellaceae bacterium]